MDKTTRSLAVSLFFGCFSGICVDKVPLPFQSFNLSFSLRYFELFSQNLLLELFNELPQVISLLTLAKGISSAFKIGNLTCSIFLLINEILQLSFDFLNRSQGKLFCQENTLTSCSTVASRTSFSRALLSSVLYPVTMLSE